MQFLPRFCKQVNQQNPLQVCSWEAGYTCLGLGSNQGRCEGSERKEGLTSSLFYKHFLQLYTQQIQ